MYDVHIAIGISVQEATKHLEEYSEIGFGVLISCYRLGVATANESI